MDGKMDKIPTNRFKYLQTDSNTCKLEEVPVDWFETCKLQEIPVGCRK